MKLNFKSKKVQIICILIVVLIVASFFVYGKLASADTAANKIAIKQVKLNKIETGASNFDSSDGLDYSNQDSYSSITGYIPGNDNNSKNRIVRSFDTLSYNFDYTIMSKDGSNDYEERTVDIKVTIPENISKYVSFTKDGSIGETSHTYSFNDIDTYGSFNSKITLYVLGAPNGTKISPKFEIQESTNTDSNYTVNLGSISFDTEKVNYEYNSEKTNKYSDKSLTTGFYNYMPTIVSSKEADYDVNLIGQTTEGQKTTYNNITGRYLSYVLGIKILGNDLKGIKGLTMPDGSDITFSISASQNGNTKTVNIDDSWIRLYGSNNVSGIESIAAANPYSTNSTDASKLVKNPGEIKVTKTDSGYNASISGYKINYTSASVNADGTKISNKDHYIGTYAVTVFSPRTESDGKNDIVTSLNVKNVKIKDVSGSEITLSNYSSNATNKYYEVKDYSLTGEFYDSANNKIASKESGTGAVSKGENVTYKTTFNYKKTMSDQGLKEVIKVDPDAYRVMQNGDKDIKITVEGTGDKKLSQDDFEITYLTGSFDNSNYKIESKTNVSKEDSSIITSACSKSISSYTKDQIMNIYGGPCIKANDVVEQTFKKISDAKTSDNNEIPITKIVIQTKKGVKLPDSAKVTVEVLLRVRNVSDLTKTYQATVVASSSDYDDVLTYYAPRVTNDENSITSPNNYIKTVYNGNTIASKSTNAWGDSLKIVNFTSREEITVKNKNSDGSIKTNYDVSKNDTLLYNIKTTINDENERVGADDTWYINHLKVIVTIPEGINYVPDKNLGTPEVTYENSTTKLIYTLPYTKPNMKIDEINFKATLSPKIKGNGVPLTVTSTVEAINVNNEKDTSYFSYLTGSFTIYATGIENVIVTQKIGENGSKVEKNSEFSYILDIYNNTNKNLTDYAILDILPNKGDRNGSDFNGTYKAKIELPSTMENAKVYCSNQEYSKLNNEVLDSNNEFKECNLDDYTEITAIKITNINLEANKAADSIRVTLKPENNNYSDKYVNSFVGASKTYTQNESNKIEASVISRNISGRVFIDNNENGIEDNADTYYKDMPVTLYKLDSDNNMKKISDATTDNDGKYIFKDLDVGRYKIRANYNSSLYDLTLRYATEDKTKDSDGYKVDDNIIEISNKRTPDESDGIRVTREIESIKDMNIGLISRKTFGFDIKKYITRIDLNYNNTLNTFNYDNQTKVLLSVRNSLRATAKVYYGIEITNNSTSSGYVKLINEDIPVGLTFNSSDELNKDWFYSDGEIRSIALENDLINPGEKRYLTIALDMPSQIEARTFINTVTLLEVEKKEPEIESTDSSSTSNTYKVGEAVRYAGIDFHVINTVDKDNEQILTLLADSKTVSKKMGHMTSGSSVYRWSDSEINKYINNSFINENSLNLPILADTSVCDDASGLQSASYGGTLKSEGKCVSNMYNTYKVRLLTENEYNSLKQSNNSDLSWLYGSSDFWLMNSVYKEQKHDSYGNITSDTDVKNYAKYVNKTNSTVQNATVNTTKEVRPVITVLSKNIIPE